MPYQPTQYQQASPLYGGGFLPMSQPVGGGIPGSPGGTAGSGAPLTNHVNTDPNLSENIDWIRERRNASNLQAQKGRAFGQIDEQAGAAGRGIEENLARRGMANSGVGIEAQNEAAAQAARAKVAAGIDLDTAEQKRQDALALGAADIMQAPGRQNLAQQGLNLQQYGQQNAQNQWLAQFQAQQQQQQLGNYMNMMQMFNNVPGGAPSGGGMFGSPRAGAPGMGGRF